MGRWRKVLAGVNAALAIGVLAIPAFSQTADVVEEWRRTVPDHVGVMMDLDPNDNVLALGYGLGPQVLTRKYAPDGSLLWERARPVSPNRALPTWISTDPFGTRF